MKRSLWLANVYKWVIRKLKEKKYTRFTGFGDGTGKSINHMGARDDFWPFRHFEHLQLSLLPQPLLGIFRFLFRVSLQPVGGEQFGLPGCLCGLSVSQQAHMGERLLSELAASQMPPGAWLAVKPQLMKKPTRWGKRRACQWKLNHLSSSTFSPPPPPPWRFSSPLLPRVQQGKLYRPKGRLTSPEPWNRSDLLPGFGVRAAVTHCAQRRKAQCWNYEHRFLKLQSGFFFSQGCFSRHKQDVHVALF